MRTLGRRTRSRRGWTRVRSCGVTHVYFSIHKIYISLFFPSELALSSWFVWTDRNIIYGSAISQHTKLTEKCVYSGSAKEKRCVYKKRGTAAAAKSHGKKEWISMEKKNRERICDGNHHRHRRSRCCRMVKECGNTHTWVNCSFFLLLAQRTNTRAEPELFQLNTAAREFDLSTFPFLPEFTVVGFLAPLMTMMMMIFAKTTTTHR